MNQPRRVERRPRNASLAPWWTRLLEHIAILDETGTIIAVNRAWRKFAKSNPPVATNVFEGANYLRVCELADGPDAEDGAAIAAGIRAVMHDPHQSFSLEYPCHSPREQRWFIARVTRFARKGPIRIVVAHENVTARKQAEQALRAAELKYRSLFERSRDALITLDPRSEQFTSANPSAVAMFRARDEADFLSRPPEHYSSRRQSNGRVSAELAREIIERAMREGSCFIDWTCARVDGTEFPATLLLTRIECAGDTMLQGTIRDVTVERRRERYASLD